MIFYKQNILKIHLFVAQFFFFFWGGGGLMSQCVLQNNLSAFKILIFISVFTKGKCSCPTLNSAFQYWESVRTHCFCNSTFSYRMFYLIIGILFGNYMLTVSNKVEEYLWLYFGYFLNFLSIFGEIHCKISSYRHYNNLNASLSFSGWNVFIMYEKCIMFGTLQ